MFYVDDGIFFAREKNEIDKTIKELRNTRKTKRKLVLDNQGDIKDYLGINFERIQDGRIKLTQPQIISNILTKLGINKKWTAKQTATSSTKILHRNANKEAAD